MSRGPFTPPPGPPTGAAGPRQEQPAFRNSPLPPPVATPQLRIVRGDAPEPPNEPTAPRRRRLKPVWRAIGKLSRLAMLLLIIGGLMAGAAALPWFRIESVVVLGGEFTEAELEEHFALSQWEQRPAWHLLTDRGDFLRLVRQHPRIADASLHFAIPGRLELHLREKERYAALVDGDTAYIIASDFSCMGVEPADRVQASRLMYGLAPSIFFDAEGQALRDPFPDWPPQPGRDNMDRYYYAKLLQLWRWIDAETNPPLSQVAGLSIDPVRGIALHYRLGGQRLYAPILLGSGADLETKYGQALTLYRSGMFRDRQDAEIDLRFNRSVVRTISPAALAAQQGWLAGLPAVTGYPGTIMLEPARLPARQEESL